ncbi:MAG: hypothetical protein CL876_05535 [Dehalococcoidales bacterium]|jgi:hypothetical protein|nr:hypothetical protein [Dehalococcoidales bacterium]
MNIKFNYKQDSIAQSARSIELLIQQDPGARGLGKWGTNGGLFPVAVSLAGGKHILVITGFYILDAGTIETDGPPGVIVLADALCKAGKTVTILTDKYAEDIMKAGMKSIGCEAELMVFAVDEKINPDSIIRSTTTHCIALERPGLAADGLHHNFRGINISDYVAPLDDVFLKCTSKGILTIGIGDGGNELGMGNVSEAVDKYIAPHGALSCKIQSDYCICAGVSNWAGYALTGLIALLCGKNLMPDFASLTSIIDSIVKAGAVDGVTCKQETTVDNLPRTWEDGIYKQIYAIAFQQ